MNHPLRRSLILVVRVSMSFKAIIITLLLTTLVATDALAVSDCSQLKDQTLSTTWMHRPLRNSTLRISLSGENIYLVATCGIWSKRKPTTKEYGQLPGLCADNTYATLKSLSHCAIPNPHELTTSALSFERAEGGGYYSTLVVTYSLQSTLTTQSR